MASSIEQEKNIQYPEKPHHLTLILSKFDFEIPTFEKKKNLSSKKPYKK